MGVGREPRWGVPRLPVFFGLPLKATMTALNAPNVPFVNTGAGFAMP